MLRNLVTKLGSKTIFLPLGCMGLIFLLSSIPGGRHELLGYEFQLAPDIGNLLHLPAYAVLATLWMIALESRGVPARRAALLACVYATLFGAADEVHQSFVPLRCMDARDVLANLLGALAAALAWPWTRSLFFEPGRNARRGITTRQEASAEPPSSTREE
jgi:VanZ family protein